MWFRVALEWVGHPPATLASRKVGDAALIEQPLVVVHRALSCAGAPVVANSQVDATLAIHSSQQAGMDLFRICPPCKPSRLASIGFNDIAFRVQCSSRKTVPQWYWPIGGH